MSNFFFKKRIESKLTQEEFSKKFGIRQSYWSKIENLKVIPTIELLCKISKKLDIPPCYLVDIYVCKKCVLKANCNRRNKL